MFKSILIANRGEIALRVIRACKEMGIRTVAVYSAADKDCSHIAFADEAICIGPASSAKSYLNIFAIIDAAVVSDVEAIHPGYGFLSENPRFVEICEECGITFIGPHSAAMKLMGDKSQARATMKQAKIPIVPGSNGNTFNDTEAARLITEIGYPIIIKASSGGGGRGMRVVYSQDEFKNNFMTASREAEAAFGDPSIYIEKYLTAPRHIEVQILSDDCGNTIHLGERDCTIQRRHQKMIEESPSIALDDGLRQKIGDIAVKVAKTVGYVNAGTVEFLLDTDKKFYFMEMNTRVQVEHPVTEAVTGIDIVKEQIRIAAGERLSITQDDVCIQGHAIECRINAENPEKGFMPSAGEIKELFIPGGMGVRVDTHIYKGYIIPPHYDSMIGKLIVYGKTRDEALQKARACLGEFVIGGVDTTIDFLKKIISHPVFCQGDYSTHFLDELLQVSLE
ncbi:acetyl-CoA carboxylase biotin carboxylase subunit [Chlamydiota bacterium]